jgi:hypothetical protein
MTVTAALFLTPFCMRLYRLHVVLQAAVEGEEGEVVVPGTTKPEHCGTALDTAAAAAATAAGATTGATTAAAAAGTRPAVWAPPTRKDIRAVGPRAIPTAEQVCMSVLLI